MKDQKTMSDLNEVIEGLSRIETELDLLRIKFEYSMISCVKNNVEFRLIGDKMLKNSIPRDFNFAKDRVCSLERWVKLLKEHLEKTGS